MASGFALGRSLGRAGLLRFAPSLSILGSGAVERVTAALHGSSSSSSSSTRALSTFSKWKTSFLDGFDQALAGPGQLANAERVIADFTRGGGDFEEGDWSLQTDKGIGGTTRASVEQGRQVAGGEPQERGENNFLRFSGTLCAPFALPQPPKEQKPKRRKEEGEELELEEGEGEGEGAAEEGGTPKPAVRLGTAFAVLQNKGVFDGVDMEPYRSLVLRVRGDGRKYIVSLRTENWIIPGTVSVSCQLSRTQSFGRSEPSQSQRSRNEAATRLLTRRRKKTPRIGFDPTTNRAMFTRVTSSLRRASGRRFCFPLRSFC